MIFKSRFPDAQIPDVSLTDYVFEHAAAFGHYPALIDGPTGRRITYAELEVLTRRVAAGLTSRGFKRGDALCIFSPNVPEYAPVFFGVSLIGGVNTTANPMYGAEELARQLRDSGARIIVTVPQLAERSLQAAQLAGGAEVIVFGEAAGCTPFAAFVTSGDAVPAVTIDPANDVVALPYSSGTTGLPKGVMLTHRNLVSNLAQIEFVDTSGPGDHTIGILPFFHIYGMVVILCAILRRGATVVTMPQFDLETYLRLTQEYKVASAYLVPPVALALAKHPLVDKYDLSSLQMVNSGAAPMSGELEDELHARLNVFAKQGYGMTETSPVTHFTPNDRAMYKPGSCGLLVPSTECRILDIETGRELGPNERGELYMRGPQVMKGYLNRPDATAECLDGEGWLRTGDVAYADEDGFFYIVDRLKEFIKYKGYQVAPAELEAVLLSHPKVADAAVIPMADDEAGEVPKAFVVMRAPVEARELMEFVAGHVAPYKKVRVVEFIDKIPKSASGKILRRELIAFERAKVKA